MQKKSKRPKDEKPVETAVRRALEETGGVTVTGGVGVPTVVRGAPRDPFEGMDEPYAVVPERQLKREPDTLPSPPDSYPTREVALIDRPDNGLTVQLNPLWSARIDKMSSEAGMPRESFVASLLRRAWTGMPLKARGGP